MQYFGIEVNMQVLKFGFGFWKKRLPYVIIVQLISYAAIVADLSLPMLSGMLMNCVVRTENPKEVRGFFGFLLDGTYGDFRTPELLGNIALIFFAILITRIILIYIKNISNQKLGLSLETELREKTYAKLMELDGDTVSEFNTGELLTIVNMDTIMFKEMFCRMIPNICDSVFILIYTMAMLFIFNGRFLIIPLLLIPFLVASLIRFRSLAKSNFDNIRECNSRMNLTVQENIEAVRLVRSFTNEGREIEKFEDSNEKLKKSHISQILLSSKFEVIFSSIKQIAYVGTFVLATILIMKDMLNIGDLIACTSYAVKFMDHISQINNTLFQMQQQIVSGRKMMNFMNCESKIPDNGVIAGIKEKPSITIKGAGLVLEERQVLKNINIDIPYGKKIGVVGGTGSGKSVLLESLIRIHDISCGSIEINGKNINEYTLNELREKFSFVFQEVFLFSNTIDSNIAYSRPEIEKDSVVRAAKLAQAHTFITDLSDGYETIVGERGLGISGGQKQRVSIARALLKDADILVFDDSTSALDVETERKLLSEIKEFYPEKTIIISAHRMTSVADCDEILYMQDGEIIERGGFDDLIKLNGRFADVYNVQYAQRNEIIDFDALAQRSRNGN